MDLGVSSAKVASDQLLRFGAFEADLRSGELRKGGVKVKIQDLPFQALKLLLSRPNEVLSREDFRKALWPPDVFVDFDRGITSAINRLRDALGDSAENPVFVETVGRRGYRWIAPTHFPQLTPPIEEKTPAEAPPFTPSPLTHAWQWAYVPIVLALFLVIWIYRPSSRSAKAGTKTPSLAVSSNQASPRHPVNHEAEQFYLQGRFYWNKRTPEDLNKAVDAFTQAIVHDPNYSAAYVGLADCYNLLREYTAMPEAEAYPRALAAAKKAVELDDQSSEAHASLGFVSFYGMWDAATADREFRRALELNPNNAIAHHWFATYLMARSRFPEALTEIESAQALDPNSRSILADKGQILWVSGMHDEGIRLLKQLEAADPNFASPHRYLRYAYQAIGDYPNYLLELKQDALLTHDRSVLRVFEAAQKGYSAGGRRSMLEYQLREEEKMFREGLFSPYLVAQTCSLLGKKSEAMHYLQAAYDKRSDGLYSIMNDQVFNNLHTEPAFRQLVARVGVQSIG